jgi:N-dimethylarginine dimethylaminohydrolase
MRALVTDPADFARAWQALPMDDWGEPCARGALLMAPEGLSSTAVTCADNRYMVPERSIDGERAHRQHRELVRALASERPTWVFPGDPATPDATFLNNAFASAPGRLLLGAMRYPERQRETARPDLRGFFGQVLGCEIVDLAGAGVAELTGSLVIDRRRGVGLCGLGERCDLAGARAMHEAFGLRLTFGFDLAPGEYHSNVVLSVLAGRTLVLCRHGLADPAVAQALVDAYAGDCIELTTAEKDAFAGNCIALRDDSVWMSATAAAALEPATRDAFARSGWRVRAVELDEIERAGGSLRCCVAELF